MDHPWRTHLAWGSHEWAEAPAHREHKETMAQGEESQEYRGKMCNHPVDNSGVRGTCILGLAPLLDIVRDANIDYMHILKNAFERMFFPLFAGERIPSDPRANNPPKANSDNYEVEMARFNMEQIRSEEAVTTAKKCTFSSRSQQEVDKRVRALSKVFPKVPYSLVIPPLYKLFFSYSCIIYYKLSVKVFKISFVLCIFVKTVCQHFTNQLYTLYIVQMVCRRFANCKVLTSKHF